MLTMLKKLWPFVLKLKYARLQDQNEKLINSLEKKSNEIYDLKWKLRKASRNDKRDPKTGRFVKVKD